MPEIEKKSPAMALNTADWKRIGKGALIAIGGAALTYAGPILLNLDYSFDLYGQHIDLTALVVAGLSAFINMVRLWLQGKTPA